MAEASGVVGIDDIIQKIAAVARDKGSDDFRLVIDRRPSQGAAPKRIATLDGARVEHFSAPETWVPRFIGGGMIQLKAYHVSDPSMLVGMPSYNLDGNPKDPDPSVVDRSDWLGPPVLVFPRKPDAADPLSHIAAPFTEDGSASRATGKNGEGGHPNTSAAEMRILAQSDALRKQELELGERAKRMEIEAIKRDSEARIRAAEERVKDLERRFSEERSHPVAPPQSDAVVLALADMRKAEIEARAADRAMNLRLTELQMQHQTEVAKIQADAARASGESSKVLLEALLNKPAIDPVFAKMMEKNDTSQLLSSMSTVLQNTASQHISMMGAMLDMGIGGGEKIAKPEKKSIGVQLLESLGRLLIMGGGQQGQARPAGPVFQQPQLPPAQVDAGPAVVPAPGQPGQPPTAQPAQGQPGQPPTAQPVPGGPPSIIQQIATAIQNRSATTKEVAEAILQNWSEPSVLDAIKKAGGDPRVLLDNMLTEEWLDVEENRRYGAEVIRTVLEQGIASGIIPPEVKKDIDEIVKDFIEAD
jgi:hypothetical protein